MFINDVPVNPSSTFFPFESLYERWPRAHVFLKLDRVIGCMARFVAWGLCSWNKPWSSRAPNWGPITYLLGHPWSERQTPDCRWFRVCGKPFSQAWALLVRAPCWFSFCFCFLRFLSTLFNSWTIDVKRFCVPFPPFLWQFWTNEHYILYC
jgi:hypothetical protein